MSYPNERASGDGLSGLMENAEKSANHYHPVVTTGWKSRFETLFLHALCHKLNWLEGMRLSGSFFVLIRTGTRRTCFGGDFVAKGLILFFWQRAGNSYRDTLDEEVGVVKRLCN